MTQNRAASQTAAECKSCGRALTADRSVARGRGPVCQRRYERLMAAVGDATPEQVSKATELIGDGGLVQVGPTTWLAVSSDGRVRYEVSVTTAGPARCTCKAGQYDRRCYHVVAAAAMAA